MNKEKSGIWSIAQRYSDAHDRVLGTTCGCKICQDFGSLDWNKYPNDIEMSSVIGLKARNALIKVGIISYSQLSKKTEREILSIKNIGRKGLREIESALKSEGLRLCP